MAGSSLVYQAQGWATAIPDGADECTPGVEGDTWSGFVIVTNESAGGMIDIHNRRPVALLSEDARDGLDLGFDYKQAEMIARERSLPSDAFEWYRVSRDVNGYKMQDAHLIELIDSQPRCPRTNMYMDLRNS
ncbi:MAG: SOS response-associated peptidase family protein [Pseudomonadota bacterium]